MKQFNIILAAVGLLLFVIGFLLRQRAVSTLSKSESPPKKLAMAKTLWTILTVLGGWLFVTRLIMIIFDGAIHDALTVEIMPEQMSIFGLNISPTIFIIWFVMALLLVLALIVRIFVVPKFKDVPYGLQNALEATAGGISKATAWVVGIPQALKRRREAAKLAKSESLSPPEELKPKKKRKLWIILPIIAGWLIIVELLGVIFGKQERGAFTVEISPERMNILGISVSTTVLMTWCIMAVLLVLVLIVRIFVIPKFKDEPHGLQNVLEIAVGEITKYTDSKVEEAPSALGSYIFTVAVFMVSCASVELIGARAPTADITLTFAMAIITFIMINYYGIRRKGVRGRIKGLSQPSPIILPIKIICDCAIPVSLACRLFGNMLGGMIVMELLYYALGSAAIGIPSVIGLYFNVFHPLIQAFIFITLTLTFINEAVETNNFN